MKSARGSFASRYSVAFVLCLICLMILMASAVSGSLTSPFAAPSLASSARAETSAEPRPSEPLANLLAPRISPLAPVGTTVTATKIHTPSGNRMPGDTLTYTVVITNTGGSDATGVNFTDTIDPNTTFSAGTLRVSPIAVNDTYQTIGNVNISVPAGSGLLANDLNPGGMGTLAITAFDATSANGGTVTVNTTDGSFTYNPAAAFRGPTDTFTYTLGNGTGLTDSATVTINIAGMIWFVDNSPGAPGSAPGDGRLTNPFRSFGGASSFNTIATDAANDAIFIYTGTSTYTGGVTLLSGQKLIGQGAGASILSITGFSTPSGTNQLPGTSGTNPTIAAAVDNITLGSGNTVRGVTLNVTAVGATALIGSSFGTLTLAETAIGGTNGRALNLTTGTLSGPVSSTAAFTSISSSNSSTTGISLTSVGGTMSSGSTTITNPTGIGLSVGTSSAALNFAATSVTGSGGTGVSLLTITGAVTFAALDITPDAGQRCLLGQENSGTITSTSGTLTASSNAIAVEITKTTGNSPLAMALTSVSASGGTNGIRFIQTSGTFAVNGDGTGHANGSGGTLSNITGGSIGDAPVYALTASGTITLKSMNMSLNTNCFSGPFFDDFAGGTLTVNVTGCTFVGVSTSVVQNKALLHFNAGNAAAMTVNVQNSFFFNNRTYGMFAEAAGTASLDVTLNQSGFGTDVNTGAPVNNPGTTITNPPPFSLGITNSSSANVTYNITNNTFWGGRGLDGAIYAVSISGASTTSAAHLDGFFNNNKIGKAGVLSSGCANGCAGLGLLPGTAGSFNANVSGNDIRQVNAQGIDFFNSVTAASGTSIGHITNNTIAEPDTTGSPLFQRAIVVSSGNSGGATATWCAEVTGNNISGAWQASSFIRITTLNTTGVLTIPGLTPTSGATGAQVDTYIESVNTVGAGNSNTTVGGAINGGGPCAVVMMSAPAADVSIASNRTVPAAAPLTDEQLSGIVSAAINHWISTGISHQELDRLRHLSFKIAGLQHPYLSEAYPDEVIIDRTAAGYGWFVDSNPDGSLEFDQEITEATFGAGEHSLARSRIDLFTVVMHAMSRVLAADAYKSMAESKSKGESQFSVQSEEPPILKLINQNPALRHSVLSPGVRRVLMNRLIGGNLVVQPPIRSAGQAKINNPTLADILRPQPPYDRAGVTGPWEAKTHSSNSLLNLKPAVFNPRASANLTGNYERSARRMSYAPRAREAAIAAPLSGETVTQGLGTIPVNEKVTLQFQVTINNPLPANVCVVTNPAPGSGVNVTGTNFTSVTIAPDSATIVKPPTIGACPTDITKNTDPGLCTAVAMFATPTSDACPVATVTCVPASGFAFPKGVTTVTCTAANGNPPNATCSFTVTVNDNQAPVITGCTNIATNTAPGVCTATATYTPTATDNCDGSRTVTCNPTSGSTFAKGVTTVTCMASDANTPTANTSMCTFTVTVNDNQAPIVTCPPSGGAFAASDCLPSQRSAYTGATLYSTGGNTVTNAVLFGFSPCTAPPVSGMVTINFTGTLTGDLSTGGPSTHFQAPVTGSMNVTFNNLTGSTRTFDTEMLQLDISGGNLPANVRLRESPTLASTGQTKITTVTGGFHIDSFFDVFMELSTNSGAIFTPDPTARHISAVQSTDTDACTAVVNYAAATATDNCDGTLTPTCTPASGATFSKGTTTVTCSATDSSMLTGSCTFTVTVVDTQLPTLTCPNNISVIGNVCQTETYTTPTPSDNCTGATASCAPPSGTCFAVGTTTVTCTATDTSGNTNSCSFTVTVTPCTVTCPGDISDNLVPGTCAHVETFSDPTTTGQCGTVTCAPASGASFPKGVTTVTCTTAAGPSCSFTVNIHDNEAPVLSGCNNVSANTASNACSAAVNYTQPTASDVCDGTRTVTCNPASGQTFNKGVTTVSCSASDLSSNTGNCTFTVTVTDNVPPAFTGCTNVLAYTASNSCDAVVNYTQPAATDNCDGARPVTCNPPAGSTFVKGVTTVTCTASDANTPTANTATCMFTVTVTDNVAPVVTGCTNLTANTTSSTCDVVVTFTQPTANDNCDGARTVTCNPASGTAFAKGVTTVTCSASDTSNNTGSCSFTVTVTDNVAPVFSGCTDVSANTASNSCDAVVNYTQPTASDNCDGARTVVCSPTSGSVFPKGVTTVSCSASDTSGNPANCTFTVTVTDNVAPVLSGCNNVSANTASNACTAVVTYTQPTANDNCDGSRTVTCNPASGSTFSKGVTTVSCSASDTSNNTGNCTFTVTVTDTTPPVITCPAPVTHGTDPGVCNAKVTYPNATATDNCSGVGTPVCTPASGTTFQKGVTTVTCNVTDASSNPASCTFTVTVNDTENPTVTCPGNISFTTPGNNDACGFVNYATPSGSDNCGVQSVVCTPPSGLCFPVGMTTVTCTVTDTSNRMGSCSFKITVSNPCTITCPADQTASTGPGAPQCGTAVNYPAPATTGGGCGTVACSPASGLFFPVGMTTVMCTTNGPSCSFKVTVVDNTPPVFPNCGGITMTAQPSCPFATSTAVSFTTPAATDNCTANPTVVCNPPAGSMFPVGTTSVTCTATDAANNTAMCTFGVNVFSFCLQDDSSPGNVVFVNATTGDYLFCSGGVQIASGRGNLTVRGCQFGIEHVKGDRRVHIGGDTSANNGLGAGTAFIQKANGHMVIQITDRNLANNTCSCSSEPPPGRPRDLDPPSRIDGGE